MLLHHRTLFLALIAAAFAALLFYAPREAPRVPSVSKEQSADEPTAQLVHPPSSAPNAEVANALITVEVRKIPEGYTERGTSFALGNGLWLTARHVVGNDCGQIIMIVDGKNVSASIKYLAPEADLAVLEAPGAGSEPGFPIEHANETEGQSAFAFGFPQGTLGGTQDVLIGRAKLRLRGHLSGTAPVLAWIEIERYPNGLDSLGGISGGPMLDERGNVVGIIVAASVRRGRNYTVAPEILLDIQHQLGSNAQQQLVPAKDAVTPPVSLEASANTLHRDARIAETYCIPQ
jgi:S1-C subfamily serine protease